jgi:hypothetical protein
MLQGVVVADKIELALGGNPEVYARIVRLAQRGERATLCWSLMEFALNRLSDDEVIKCKEVYKKGRKKRGGGRKKKGVE